MNIKYFQNHVLIGENMFRLEDVQALGDLSVAEILKTEVITVLPTTPMFEIIRIFRDYNFEGIPVVEKGILHGMALRRELLNFYFIPSRDLDEADTRKLFRMVSMLDVNQPVSGFMDSDPQTVTPDTKVSRLAQMMLENDIFTIPVVHSRKTFWRKEINRFVGIVTLTDLMPLLYEAICCE